MKVLLFISVRIVFSESPVSSQASLTDIRILSLSAACVFLCIIYITANICRQMILAVPPYIVKSFFLENQGFFSVSSINISEEGAIGMDISLYLVRK